MEVPDSEDDSPISPVTKGSINTTVNAQECQPVDAARKKVLVGTENGMKQAESSPRALALQQKVAKLRTTIESTQSQLADTLDKLAALPTLQQDSSSASVHTKATTHDLATKDLTVEQQQTLVQAQNTLDRHIQKLGKYNQLKDIAMAMLGMVAEKEGKTLREVMDTRGVVDDD